MFLTPACFFLFLHVFAFLYFCLFPPLPLGSCLFLSNTACSGISLPCLFLGVPAFSNLVLPIHACSRLFLPPSCFYPFLLFLPVSTCS
jgi:hypothetical protein